MLAYENLLCDLSALDARILAWGLELDKYLRALLRKYWNCQTIKAEMADAIKLNTELIECLPGKK